MSALVSVIICTRNRGPSLALCLASLAADGSSTKAEVIVVDNGSTVATGDAVATAARETIVDHRLDPARITDCAARRSHVALGIALARIDRGAVRVAAGQRSAGGAVAPLGVDAAGSELARKSRGGARETRVSGIHDAR